MFDYVGARIKGLAKGVFWTGQILSVLGGGVNLVKAAAQSDSATAVYWFLMIIMGAVGSWIGSLLLYGFGQLITNTDKLVALNNNKYVPDNNSSYKDTIVNLSDTDVREEQPQKYGNHSVSARDLRVKSDPDVRVCVSPLDEIPKQYGNYYTPSSELGIKNPSDKQG